MEIIAIPYFPYESCVAVHAILRAGEQDSIRLEGFRVCAWVEVTHETKNEVMRRVSERDLKAVGCRNPDIYVNGKRDDRIVLTRPKSHRNEVGKARKHITSVRASDVFGANWPNKINVLKFERLGQFREEVARTPQFSRVLRDENAFVFFVYTRSYGWVAYLCSRHATNYSLKRTAAGRLR